MGRRGITVAVGAILLILLSWQSTVIQVPYVEMGPGPTYDTLGEANGKPVISVTGATATKSAGQLRMTTVQVQPSLTLWEAMRGWLRDDLAVVPRELIYPPDKSEQDIDRENENAFRQSQSSAETAALRALGYPVDVTVTEIADGFAAQGVLQVGDIIQTVDGTPVTSTQKLSQLVRDAPAETARQVGYRRGSEQRTVSLTTRTGEDGNPRLGVVVEQRQPHPFELKIELDRIGGPSAGLMFTLGIIDTLKPEDLTGGLIIAGTGTIDDEGNVGVIGGIAQKLVAAKNKAKAKAFFTPEGNCAEALANAQPGLPLVKVATLDDALKALELLRAGQTPPLCR